MNIVTIHNLKKYFGKTPYQVKAIDSYYSRFKCLFSQFF